MFFRSLVRREIQIINPIEPKKVFDNTIPAKVIANASVVKALLFTKKATIVNPKAIIPKYPKYVNAPIKSLTWQVKVPEYRLH